MAIHKSLETGDHRSVPQKNFYYSGQKCLIDIVNFSYIIEAYIKCKQKNRLPWPFGSLFFILEDVEK